jgi:opacity protein-like surface antigen
MLARVPMKRASLAVTLVALAGSSASAGTYLGLGIGSAPEVNEQTDRFSSDGRSGKILAGMRFGNVSVEGAISKFDMARTSDRNAVVPFGDQIQAAAAAKLSLPLGNNFEAFGRVGVHKTWLRADQMPDINNAEGTGYLVGAGVEYRLNLVVGQGSIFVDYQYNDVKLEGERFMLDGSSRMFSIGLTVGL